jgi:hypothetical protein
LKRKKTSPWRSEAPQQRISRITGKGLWLWGVVDQVDASGTLSKAIQVSSIFVAIPNLRLDSSSNGD